MPVKFAAHWHNIFFTRIHAIYLVIWKALEDLFKPQFRIKQFVWARKAEKQENSKKK